MRTDFDSGLVCVKDVFDNFWPLTLTLTCQKWLIVVQKGQLLFTFVCLLHGWISY